MNEAQKQFNKTIEDLVSQRLQGKATVSVNMVYKPNLPELYGITFHEESSCISPVLYLNGYFNQYQNGIELDSIVDEILRCYEEHRNCGFDFSASAFTDFDSVSHRICCKVINAKMNDGYLSNGIAHTLILNGELAVIYYVLLQSDSEGSASITIREEHLKLWGKTVGEINTLAIEQTPAITGYVLKDMQSILREMLASELSTDMNVDEDTLDNLLFQMEEDSIKNKMYVLSNSQKVNGAALAYLYPERLKAFLEENGCEKAVILPSSIHETIIVPCDVLTFDGFTEMVHEVNATQLKPDEILSEKPVLFDATNNTYTLI